MWLAGYILLVVREIFQIFRKRWVPMQTSAFGERNVKSLSHTTIVSCSAFNSVLEFLDLQSCFKFLCTRHRDNQSCVHDGTRCCMVIYYNILMGSSSSCWAWWFGGYGLCRFRLVVGRCVDLFLPCCDLFFKRRWDRRDGLRVLGLVAVSRGGIMP